MRRRNEAQLIRQLASFTAADSGPSAASSAAVSTSRQTDRDRIQVLQAAVDRLRSLESVRQALSATVDEQQRRLQQLQRPLQHEFAPLAARLTQVALRQSLYSNAFLQGRVALLTVDAASGLGLDANEAYVAHSGFSRSQMQQRQLLPSQAELGRWTGSDDGAAAHSPTRHRRQKRARVQPAAAEGSSSAAAASAGLRQYPQALQLLQALYAGERVMIATVWRCPHEDGSVWENRHTSWLASADGDRPVSIVFASSYEEAVRLD